MPNVRLPPLCFASVLLCGCGATGEAVNSKPVPTASIVAPPAEESCASSKTAACEEGAAPNTCCGPCKVTCAPSEMCDGTACVHKGLLAMGGETCLVHRSGRVICWGKLNGTIPESTHLPRPQLVDGPTDVVDIQTNSLRSCALQRGGETLCWSEKRAPKLESPMGRFLAASTIAGTCTHLSNGTAYCTDPHVHSAAREARDLTFLRADGGRFYGINRKGQALEWGYVGDALETEPAPVRRVEGAGSGKVVHLDIRGERGCAARPTGEVICWQKDNFGKVVSQPIFGAVDAVEVAVGSKHACYLQRGGTVKCWGDASYGQTGNGSTRTSNEPTQVPQLGEVVQIAANAQSSCALHRSGGVSCWGSREGGTLGDGNGASVRSPTQVTNVSQATQLSVGPSYSCAVLSSNDVWCWGRGPIREGTLQNERVARGSPTRVQLSDPVRSVHVDDAACAIHKTGNVTCWPSGIPSRAARLSGLPKTRWVVLSKKTGMALFENGRVAQLTLKGDLSPPETPVEVRVLPGVVGAVAAAWVDPALCVITKGSRISCLVNEIRGFGGFVTLLGSPIPPTPVAFVQVDGPTKPLTITGHHDGFTVAQKDGQTAVFDLGSVRTETEVRNLETNDNELWPAHGKVSAKVVDLSAAVPFSKHDLYCSTQKSAAYCYGTRNTFGELGFGDAISPPVGTPVLRDVAGVWHSASHACALAASGQVYCWGDNRDEQCGVGAEAYSALPIRVALPE
ncbi:MAG: hypothetical protein IPK82_31115 [Polyangiaceae bacterium]|nr:hypothetical protein [Polyangiaceae bacterium]